ncbi:diacylglycerol kinase family protein [Candidatus Izemoplasma sp. B36]|uniref:diacylglycerol/lipid kinase family protein n=1 Tax=Candidatus Izemoplasma sp. B36 TaxID=3242468 RepID=UPI003557C3D7
MEKVILIYNPKSGNQKFESKLQLVINLLKNKYDDVLVCKTNYPGEATELSKFACEEKYELMIIVGGDGTFNECVNGLMDFDYRPRIGYIPAGTCCDIGMSLGLSRNIEKATQNILNGVNAKMDVVKTNNRYFCYVSGNGAFIDISYVTDSKLKRKIGYLAYLVQGAVEIFTIPKLRMKIRHDNGDERGTYSLALIINSKRVAGINMVYKPSLDDGKVDVVLYKSYTPFNWLLYLISFIIPFWSTPLVKRFKSKKLEIKTDAKSRWNIDGESGGTGNQYIEVCQQAIEVIIPEKIKRKYFHNQ